MKNIIIKQNTWLILVLLFNLLIGCQTTPQRDFFDTDLLIDEQAMPENWGFLESAASKELFREGEVSGARIILYEEEKRFIVTAAILEPRGIINV